MDRGWSWSLSVRRSRSRRQRRQQTVTANPALQGLNWDLDAPNRRITSFLAKENIPYLDLLPIFRENSTQSAFPALHFSHDQHWTVEGHRLAAESVHDFLVNEKLLGP